MTSKLLSLLSAVIVAGMAQPLAAANAATLSYAYTATANGGPLGGDMFAGTFQVDSAAVTAGSGSLANLTLDVLGTSVTQSEGAFGLSPVGVFSGDGSLTAVYNFYVLSTARAAAIGGTGYVLPGSISSLALNGTFQYGTDPSGGETFAGGAVTGSLAPVAAVPEPVSLSVLGVAALGTLVMRRRKLG